MTRRPDLPPGYMGYVQGYGYYPPYRTFDSSDPDHGTLRGYVTRACRCDLCKDWAHDHYLRNKGRC